MESFKKKKSIAELVAKVITALRPDLSQIEFKAKGIFKKSYSFYIDEVSIDNYRAALNILSKTNLDENVVPEVSSAFYLVEGRGVKIDTRNIGGSVRMEIYPVFGNDVPVASKFVRVEIAGKDFSFKNESPNPNTLIQGVEKLDLSSKQAVAKLLQRLAKTEAKKYDGK